MTALIVNAAPFVRQYGTQDLSTRVLPREPEAIPQHLPKFYLFAQKGPTTPQLVVGSERDNMFGTPTFDLRGKFSNHSTVFSNLVNAEGNAQMIQRVIPEDAGPEATIIVWLDVLETTVDLYDRNIDGSIKTDVNGDPIVIGTTNGYKVKWVVTNYTNATDIQEFGQQNITTGNQVDTVTSAQSSRYPIFELKAFSQGNYGNNCGIRMWAPTQDTVASMPSKLMSEEKAYPYFFSFINRTSELASPSVVQSLFGEQSVMITLKPDSIDPLTDKRVYIGDNLLSNYQNLTDTRYPVIYGDFGTLAIYQDNIDFLLELFHTAEIPFIDGFSDFTDSPEDAGLFNFVSGVSSFNVPYHSFVFTDAVDSINFSSYTNVYAAGSSDGTMNHATHAALVEKELARYLDPNDEVQDVAYNVESIIYDSGFPLSTKYALIDFISVRKDTAVILGTHDANDRVLTASEEYSLAIALRTHLQMYPESDYFGTPVMRGLVIGRSAKLRNSQYNGYLPLTAEVAIKAARYMGAGNGRWKNGFNFDMAPGSIIENMYDINITWVPVSVRNRNWDVGLNWIQRYDRHTYQFPALKTVYTNDTSVLNSFSTMMAICQLNKIANAAWREFTGVDSLTNAQLAARVVAFVNNRVKNIFDERYVIVPEVIFTDTDLLAGYRWTLVIKIYSPNLLTVMTTYVQAFRIEDLAQ